MVKKQEQAAAQPPKAAKEIRAKGIRIMVTETEFQAIKDAAWQAHQTVSNWARDILLKHLN